MGAKFFEEPGNKITIISFGSLACSNTYSNDAEFQRNLNLLNGGSGGTAFSNPLRCLKDNILQEGIKELLVVFLTDGQNGDHEQTKIASKELQTVLDRVYSKFNVIGFGENFNV